MYLLDENKLKLLHGLMRDKGVDKVNVSMFNEQQQKFIYESYGENFLSYNGLGFMTNCILSYALAKNISMVNKKLQKEIDYALLQKDYDYAILCAKLMDNSEMIKFLEQYSKSNKYENIFNGINKYIIEARK